MHGIWTVARQTFAQIVRTKTAWVFILVLSVLLVVMPHNLQGDGTLAGRIRAYLSYSTTVTAALLSILTIFLAVDVVSADVRSKTVFSVITKPVARWQYVLGRWAGVVMLAALLLAIAAVDIYVVAQSLRGEPPRDPMDGLAVESEIFTARRRIEPVSITEMLIQRADAKLTRFAKEEPVEFARKMKHLTNTHGDEHIAYEIYRGEIFKAERERMQTVAPGRTRRWMFEGIEVAGQTTTGRVKVVKAVWQVGILRYVRFEGDEALMRRLVNRGPVQIGGVEATVRGLKAKGFDAEFVLAFSGPKTAIGRLAVGDEVEIVIDPTVELSFKARAVAGSSLPGNIVKSRWVVGHPDGKVIVRYFNREDPPKVIVKLVVPRRAIDDEGRMVAEITNLNRGVMPRDKGVAPGAKGVTLRIPRTDVSVLYRTGSFEGNFVRVTLLILGQLAFLAALGVMAGSLLSFSVGCLLCFGVLPYAIARGFLTESVKLAKGGFAETDAMTAIGWIALKVMSTVLPDFAATNRSDALVDGVAVAWSDVAMTFGTVVLLQIVVLLAIASLIFTKRELAGVQVA